MNPDNDEAMASAIMSLAKGADGREQRISAGREYVKRFENSRAARGIYDIYCEMTGI